MCSRTPAHVGGVPSEQCLVLLRFAPGKRRSYHLLGVVELTSMTTNVRSGLTLVVGFSVLSLVTVSL